jgi:hypothetical protein
VFASCLDQIASPVYINEILDATKTWRKADPGGKQPEKGLEWQEKKGIIRLNLSLFGIVRI